VAGGKSAQHAAAFSGQRKHDATVVHGVMGAPYQAFCDGSVGEFDNTVLAQTKALREKTDSGLPACGKPGDLQQQLVLARLQPAVLRSLLAEAEEAAQGIAELGECEQ
jgi:hypothetical protein